MERITRLVGWYPAVPAGAADLAGIGETAERVGDDLIAHAELLAQGGGGERLSGAGDEGEDAAGGGVLLLLALGDSEASGRRVAVVDHELEPQRSRRCDGAVLDLELEHATRHPIRWVPSEGP